MTLKASLVGKVVTDLGEGKYKIGTAYPIRHGVVITAYHVIPDIKNVQETLIEWRGKESFITKVLYESEEHDVVVLACETTDIPAIDVCRHAPESTERWDSIGFPDAGIDPIKNVRDKTPAGGHYIVQSDESCEMHLEIGSNTTENNLWRGMSGAPVFTVGTNQLTGIISQVPDNENPVFKNRIYATSIAQLLKISAKFRSATEIDTECNKHRKKHQQALLEELEELKESSSALYSSLATNFDEERSIKPEILCRIIVAKHASASTKSVEKLRLACEPFMKSLRERCELLLLYLLATKAPEDAWSGDSFHDLSVRTRMLCELKLAARYQITPKLTQVDKEIAGQHAIHDHSSEEVGFKADDNALQQAKIIAYHIYKQTDEEYRIEEMDSEDWDAADDALKARRIGINPELIRFELNATRESEHPLASEEVRLAIHKLLPALPIAFFGSKSEDDEKKLRVQVKVFYERLEQLG